MLYDLAFNQFECVAVLACERNAKVLVFSKRFALLVIYQECRGNKH